MAPKNKESAPSNNGSGEEMLLYFEHHNKCTYVKNMLDMNKESLRQHNIKQAKNFFVQIIKDLPMEESKSDML